MLDMQHVLTVSESRIIVQDDKPTQSTLGNHRAPSLTLTTREVADLLCVHMQTVREMRRDGRLKVVGKLEGRRFYSRAEVERLKRRRDRKRGRNVSRETIATPVPKPGSADA